MNNWYYNITKRVQVEEEIQNSTRDFSIFPIDNIRLLIPHIGTNNRWYVGEYDTGISAIGPRGKSAYDIYLDTVPEGQTPMTEEEWIQSISSTIDISVLVNYATKQYVDQMIQENCCHIKHVFLTQEEYDNLEVKDENTLYFIKEDNNTTGWVFGDNFPIILGGESNNETWKFGDNFPIILTN